MKYLITLLLISLITFQAFAQMNILVDKIGTTRKYFYTTGQKMKLRVIAGDSLVRGKVWDIRDSFLILADKRNSYIKLTNIGSVYKQFAFPRHFAIKTAEFGGIIFLVIVVNHLINNEQVFTPDLFIISGAFIGASLISLSFSQKRCKIGVKWKLKVLDFSRN